jgi:uncharacterized membrane protein YcaP (DUF421 family)
LKRETGCVKLQCTFHLIPKFVGTKLAAYFFMNIFETISHLLGLGIEPKDLTFLQIALRAVIVFLATLALARVAARRFLSKITALDAIVGFILASMLARAVNGSAPFFPTLGGGFVVVLLHRVLAALAYRFKWFETLTKGGAELLIKDGRLHQPTARRHYLTERDISEELRLNGSIEFINEAKAAFVERSGGVSVVKSKD